MSDTMMPKVLLPRRATVLVAPVQPRMRRAISRSSQSPVACPRVSLICLKRSMSISSSIPWAVPCALASTAC
jgi:hypothetical protein